MIRVLVADDHVFYRAGIKVMLEDHPTVQIVAEAGSGAEAIRQAVTARPDVVLMDLAMPGINGVEATRTILADQPRIGILILTMSDDDSVFPAIRAGARGYLLKHATLDDLVRAVTAVHNGEAIFSPTIASRLLRQVATAPLHHDSTLLPELTQREHDVLHLIATGHDNRHIATALGLTHKTVRNYVSGILTKLQVHDRHAAAAKAHEAGFPHAQN